MFQKLSKIKSQQLLSIKGCFSKWPKKLSNIWAILDRIFIAGTFQKIAQYGHAVSAIIIRLAIHRIVLRASRGLISNRQQLPLELFFSLSHTL